MNTTEINNEIKTIREKLERIKLSPKLLNLITIIIKNPSETMGNCCKKAGYKGVIPIANGSKAREYLELSQKLQQLYNEESAILTKDEVISQLKTIAKTCESVDYQIKALALASKLLGLEAPIKTESKVDIKTLQITFEEDKNES